MERRTYAIRASLEIPLRRDAVFDFFSDAANLERITPPELSFRIITPQPITMRPGLVIDYSIRLWFVRMRWQSRITLWRPADAFTDVQVSGPYATWEHTHFFRDTPNGTRIIDRVKYQLPFGPAGRLLAPLIRAQLNRIFEYRQRAVVRLLLGAEPGAHPVRWDVGVG